MNWYDLHHFKDHLTNIEEFFIEIAANEERLLTFGFDRALSFPKAEAGLESLKSFNEAFSTIKRYIYRMDVSLGRELEQLDSEGKLGEQVSLISLKLRMCQARKPITSGIATMAQIFSFIPYFSGLFKSRELFKEETVSLHKTIINLGRLKGLVSVFSEYLSNKEISDDEVFKPSNVNPDRVISLIDIALVEIETLTAISPTERTRIEGYLHEAKKEALSSSPSWSKIIGALVIVAAITSGLADAPNAAKTIRDTIEYILGTSVEKPLQKYLPVEDHNHNIVPLGTLA